MSSIHQRSIVDSEDRSAVGLGKPIDLTLTGGQIAERKGLLMRQEIATQQFFQAHSLLKSGMATERVAEITGLTIEQVEQLE